VSDLELGKISAKEYLILCHKKNITVESGVDDLLIYIRQLLERAEKADAELQTLKTRETLLLAQIEKLQQEINPEATVAVSSPEIKLQKQGGE
jgi:hypothetical protein